MVSLTLIRPFEVPTPRSEFVVFADTRSHISQAEAGVYLTKCCRYAKKYGVYLVPGRFEVGEYLALTLISPKGKVIGGQRANHLQLDQRGQFARACDLQVFETAFGNVFLAVDADLTQPQVIRAAALAGANLVIGSRFLRDFAYLPIQGTLAAGGMARTNGLFVLDCNNMSATLAVPECRPFCPDGFLLRDCEEFPTTVVFDPEEAMGPLRTLEESFYTHYQETLWR